MKNGILKIALAAGTVLAGVHAHADAAEFIFRYRGMGPVEVAATEPEAPAFDASKLTFGGTGRSYMDLDHDGKISVGDVFWGTVNVANPTDTAGTIQISTSGLPGMIEAWPYPAISCSIPANGSKTCEQYSEITSANIDFFCSQYADYAEEPTDYKPTVFVDFGDWLPVAEWPTNIPIVTPACG